MPPFYSSSMVAYALRLRPGQDLKTELHRFVEEQTIDAACILTCVGSLQRATLRLADQSESTVYVQKMEIVSLVGTLAKTGMHLHVSLADSSGATIGGHVADGCIVYTTAEIVLGILSGYRFAREHDAVSGYNELAIYPADTN